MGIDAKHVETVRDLMEAAVAAGVKPSELISLAWPQRAPSGREG